MNDQNKAKVTAWLAERGVVVRCGVCGSTDWRLHGEVIAPARNDGYTPSGTQAVYSRSGEALMPPSIRLVAMICEGCAGVTFMHADTMGV